MFIRVEHPRSKKSRAGRNPEDGSPHVNRREEVAFQPTRPRSRRTASPPDKQHGGAMLSAAAAREHIPRLPDQYLLGSVLPLARQPLRPRCRLQHPCRPSTGNSSSRHLGVQRGQHTSRDRSHASRGTGAIHRQRAPSAGHDFLRGKLDDLELRPRNGPLPLTSGTSRAFATTAIRRASRRRSRWGGRLIARATSAVTAEKPSGEPKSGQGLRWLRVQWFARLDELALRARPSNRIQAPHPGARERRLRSLRR